MKKILLSFALVIMLLFNSSISVYASSSVTEFSVGLFDEVNNLLGEITLTAPKLENIFRILFEQIGLFVNPDKWGDGKLFDYYADYIEEKAIIDSVDNYGEYLQAHLTVKEDKDGEYEYIVDSEMMNDLYNFAVEFIEQEKGWFDVKTQKFTNLDPTKFQKQSDYDSLKTFFDSQEPNDVIWLYNCDFTCTYTNGGYANNDYFVRLYVFNSDTQFYRYDKTTNVYYVYATQNWDYIYDNWKLYNFNTKSLIDNANYSLTSSSNPIRHYYNSVGSAGPYSRDGHTIRIYKSLDDLKSYSVGQRPYLAGEQFYNYDSSVDNSTTITQTTLDNSITYGDVYNYITNNYDNPDSLTEDELRDILSDYLSQNSGNGNNSGNSGSSGGGLSGFLSGLGSLGDAILGILGKLIEYLGKAIDLVVNGISDIIEKIPQNVSGLIGALFPFLPEEFLTAIELALILGVVCIVAKMFK